MLKNKRILLTSLVVLLLLIVPSVVNAADTYTATSTINGITVNWSYELNENNQIENLKCTNVQDLTGSFSIPSTIDGKTVVSIGASGFVKTTGITEIIIPNSVEEIGNGAFKDCTKLVKINFGTGIESVGYNAFENCTSLTSLYIPKNLVDSSNHPFRRMFKYYKCYI